MRRIEVKAKQGFGQPGAAFLKKEIEEVLGHKIDAIYITKAYNIDGELSDEEMEMLGRELFADRVSEEYSWKEPAYGAAWRIEVGFLPGMTDNVGNTAKIAIADMLGKELDVYFSRVYYIRGQIEDPYALDKVADALLANKLIERWEIFEPSDRSFSPFSAKVSLDREPVVQKINLDVEDRHLEKLSRERLLALSLEEMRAIKEYYKRTRVLEKS
ncbi:MAG: hypothetical protein QXH30_03175 [Candidatus Bilamarchaeaceae archaeon]